MPEVEVANDDVIDIASQANTLPLKPFGDDTVDDDVLQRAHSLMCFYGPIGVGDPHRTDGGTVNDAVEHDGAIDMRSVNGAKISRASVSALGILGPFLTGNDFDLLCQTRHGDNHRGCDQHS